MALLAQGQCYSACVTAWCQPAKHASLGHCHSDKTVPAGRICGHAQAAIGRPEITPAFSPQNTGTTIYEFEDGTTPRSMPVLFAAHSPAVYLGSPPSGSLLADITILRV